MLLSLLGLLSLLFFRRLQWRLFGLLSFLLNFNLNYFLFCRLLQHLFDYLNFILLYLHLNFGLLSRISGLDLLISLGAFH